MKKISLALTAATILAVALFNNASAQQSAAKTSGNDEQVNLAFATTGGAHNESFSSASASSLNMRAVKDFQKSFKSVANASWFKADNGALLASFTINDVQNTVAYNKKGNWLYSIKRYGEKDLPKDIRANVRSTYYDFTITNIEEVEISQGAAPIYMVHLQDATTLKTLRISDGDMEEVQNYIKG